MEVMSSADVPTVDLHGAIVEKCGAVPQKACFGKPGCFSPHCGAKNEWVAFRLHLCCVIYLDKPHRGPPQRKLKRSIPFFGRWHCDAYPREANRGLLLVGAECHHARNGKTSIGRLDCDCP